MNRRSFFETLGKAIAGFAILPAATTYARRWVPTASGVVVPEIEMVVHYDIEYLSGTVRTLFAEQPKYKLFTLARDLESKILVVTK